jgi:hypothetical protein
MCVEFAPQVLLELARGTATTERVQRGVGQVRGEVKGVLGAGAAVAGAAPPEQFADCAAAFVLNGARADGVLVDGWKASHSLLHAPKTN